MRTLTCVGLLLAVMLPLAADTKHSNKSAGKTSDGTVQVEMKNIAYHFTDSSMVHIIRLRGELVPTGAGKIPIFDDNKSFILRITSAQISMPLDSLAAVLNQYVFAGSDSPLKDLTIEPRENAMVVKGKLRQKADLPFEATAIVSPTPDGRIRLHTEKIKAAHLPVKGILDLLGLKLANLVNMRKVKGVSADGNDLILDPAGILPPPHISGQVTAVSVQGNEIVQSFGGPPPKPLSPDVSGNYMAYRGNQLGFGKLTMHDTDLIILDMDPQDAFDFFLDDYRQQLVAGYSKTTNQFGLRVFMRDYNKLGQPGKDAIPGKTN
jgi:hypothetical protein